MATVFILGTLPPPMGGVSIYCLRRLNQLKQQGVGCKIFDTQTKISLLLLWLNVTYYRLNRKKFSIEINTSNPAAIFIIKTLGLLSLSEFIDHNSSRRFKGKFGAKLLKSIAEKCAKIKVVNEELFKNYANTGVSDFSNFEVFSPYIKPTNEEITDAAEKNAAVLRPLISRERDIVLCTAWKPTLHGDGEDLYGIGNTLTIFKNIIQKYRNKKFVLMIGELGTTSLDRKILHDIKTLEQHVNFTFITGSIPQWPLLSSTALLIRLSRSDGDSISIREALDFGCQVIATNVIKRPTGVIEVPLDDIKSAEHEVVKILSE